jgi:hypothetical protein
VIDLSTVRCGDDFVCGDRSGSWPSIGVGITESEAYRDFLLCNEVKPNIKRSGGLWFCSGKDGSAVGVSAHIVDAYFSYQDARC